MEQHLLSAGPLLNEEGNLKEAGYAFSLVKEYDRKAIKAGSLRIKEWDYYYVGDKEKGIALTIADNSYMALISGTILRFGEKTKETSSSVMKWLTKGKLHLPSTSKEGDLSFVDKKKGIDISFLHEGGKRRLKGLWKAFGGKGKDFHFDITLEETSKNSMVIATPFAKKAHFYYNQKINNQKANGYAKLGEEILDFASSYGVLDWGRGVWTYKNTWYWSSANGEVDGLPFGWNLGYGFGDTSKASENMFFVGDKVFKMNDVRFDIPLLDNGGDDFLSPWRIRSDSGDIKIEFHPIYNRHSDTNALLIRSNQNQVFGTFSGYFLYEGKQYSFNDIPGFAEKVYNRW